VFGASLVPITAAAAASASTRATDAVGPGVEVLIVAGLAGVVGLAAVTLLVAIRRA
jgi:hypothetical protein